jgi:glycerol-1-phosphate dehydrogenase [NAD(P)+]
MSRLYERFVATDIAAIEAPTQEPWEDLAERLAQHFGPLWDAVEPVARQVYELQTNGAERRAALHGQWQQIQTQVRRILGTEPGNSQQLALAGGPVRFREIGIVPAQAREAMLLARYVRARYTLLDLLAELGLLEVWIDDMLAAGDL